jgi:hypothetical protein
MKPEIVHLKLCLFTVQAYIETELVAGKTNETLHKRIVSGIESWKIFRRFSKEEALLIAMIGEDEFMQKQKQVQIAFIVYALEILDLTIARYKFDFGVSRRKMRGGRAFFATAMLREKRNNPERYAELKEIIDQSVLTAKKFFDYTDNRIREELK